MARFIFPRVTYCMGDSPTTVLNRAANPARDIATSLASVDSENFLLDSVIDGEVVLSAGNVGEPFVDADDIGDIAVAALTQDGHVGRLYELTGPRLLTFSEAVDEIGRATGREIRYVQISSDEYAAALAEAGLPIDFQWLVNYLFSTVLDGRNAHLADGVERALGRPPRDFADYARHTAAAGVWDAA